MASSQPHRIEAEIEVDVPVQLAYNQWTQFESFPSFLEGVKSVEQLDDKTLHWVVEIAGKTKEWDAEIVDQDPDRYIAWRSMAGDRSDGSVSFEALDDHRCRLTLLLTYEPETLTEKAGSALGIPKARVEADLKRFKGFIEAQGRETGAWRGAISRGQVGARPERPKGPVHGDKPVQRTRPGHLEH